MSKNNASKKIIPNKNNRELWLRKAMVEMNKLFKKKGFDKIVAHISVGFAHDMKNDESACCYDKGLSGDGIPHIFFNPTYTDTNERILATLIHEMIHAMGISKHQHPFQKVARKMGLISPWKTLTTSEKLIETLTPIAEKLGNYPHIPLDISSIEENKKKKKADKPPKTRSADCLKCGMYFSAGTAKMTENKLRCPVQRCSGQVVLRTPKSEAV